LKTLELQFYGIFLVFQRLALTKGISLIILELTAVAIEEVLPSE